METIDRDYLEQLAKLFDFKEIRLYVSRKDDALNLILILQHLKMNIYEALKEGDIDKAKRAGDRYNRLGGRITKLANTAMNLGYHKEVATFIDTANEVGFKELIVRADTKIDGIEDLDNMLASTITINGKRYLKRTVTKPMKDIKYKYPNKKLDGDKIVDI